MRRYSFPALLAAALFAISAAGYAYSSYASWATSSIPVTFYVNPANADVSASAAASAMQFAMNVWNNAGSPFRFQYGGTVSDTTTGYNNRNVAIFRNASSGSAIATTYSWWNSGGKLLDTDIVMWDGSFRFYAGTSGCGGIPNSAYIEDVATHEFGHALGLSHSTSGDATMYPSYSYCSQAFRTLAADDIAGVRALYGSAASNSAPTVTITSPANGASFIQGATVSFTASASDSQDGNLTSQIQWTDNGTAFGSGGTASRVLNGTGTHAIVARVTDSGGLQGSSQVSITVTAQSVNTAPSVTITSPANGASFVQNTTISLTATASDAQDGNLTGQIQWTDNGAPAGSGGSVSRTLTTLGQHVIVATVTDNGGLQASSQVTVTVTAPGGGGGTATLTGTPGFAGSGAHRTVLVWSGLTGAYVEVYRNNVRAYATSNGGSQLDYPGTSIPTSVAYTYKVCVYGTSTCTNTVSVSY